MPVKKGIEFMIAFVQEYLDGDMDRMGFDLDFDHYLIEHWPAMERKDAEMARAFGFYVSEQGIDQTVSLSDVQHKRLIRRQFRRFMDALDDGLW